MRHFTMALCRLPIHLTTRAFYLETCRYNCVVYPSVEREGPQHGIRWSTATYIKFAQHHFLSKTFCRAGKWNTFGHNSRSVWSISTKFFLELPVVRGHTMSDKVWRHRDVLNTLSDISREPFDRSRRIFLQLPVVRGTLWARKCDVIVTSSCR